MDNNDLLIVVMSAQVRINLNKFLKRTSPSGGEQEAREYLGVIDTIEKNTFNLNQFIQGEVNKRIGMKVDDTSKSKIPNTDPNAEPKSGKVQPSTEKPPIKKENTNG